MTKYYLVWEDWIEGRGGFDVVEDIEANSMEELYEKLKPYGLGILDDCLLLEASSVTLKPLLEELRAEIENFDPDSSIFDWENLPPIQISGDVVIVREESE